jgi:RNA polymerase sigma-70 factor, ECF subfamily
LSRPEVTELLVDVADGDATARDRLFTLVYEEMRALAASHVRRSGASVTINPTMLVHETWLKLARSGIGHIGNSAHFYNVVAQAMRQVIFDVIAQKRTDKRGDGLVRVDLSDTIEQPEKSIDQLVAIEAALAKLRACDPELDEIVEWHYLIGVPVAEIATARGVSERTIKRQLKLARVFLGEVLGPP